MKSIGRREIHGAKLSIQLSAVHSKFLWELERAYKSSRTEHLLPQPPRLPATAPFSYPILGMSIRRPGKSFPILGMSIRLPGKSFLILGMSIRLAGKSFPILGMTIRLAGKSFLILGMIIRLPGRPFPILEITEWHSLAKSS